MNNNVKKILLAITLLLSQHIHSYEPNKTPEKPKTSLYWTWENGKWILLGTAAALGAGTLAYYNQDAIKNWWLPQDITNVGITDETEILTSPQIIALQESIAEEENVIAQELQNISEKEEIIAEQKQFIAELQPTEIQREELPYEEMHEPVSPIIEEEQESTPEVIEGKNRSESISTEENNTQINEPIEEPVAIEQIKEPRTWYEFFLGNTNQEQTPYEQHWGAKDEQDEREELARLETKQNLEDEKNQQQQAAIIAYQRASDQVQRQVAHVKETIENGFAIPKNDGARSVQPPMPKPMPARSLRKEKQTRAQHILGEKYEKSSSK